MKILYDHQIFTGQKYGGISRYFFELIKRFNNTGHLYNVATVFSNNEYYNKQSNPGVFSFFPDSNFKGKERVITFFNSLKSRTKIKQGDFDLFHPTYYDSYFLNLIKEKPYVVTCHDLIHEKFSNQYPNLKKDKSAFNGKKRILENANKIIAISKTTKNDLLQFYDLDCSKIDVVYHGKPIHNYDDENKTLKQEDYILFVGNRSMYKNFSFLLDSISDLLVQNKLKLFCAGGGSFNNYENRLISSLGLEDYVIHKKISKNISLSSYYINALFFVFPSLYEGFGLPILEAFSCNCPVLLTNCGAFKEVASDSAMYFDPNNKDSLISALKELIGNHGLRKEYIKKGNLRLNNFSWEKTFEETLNVYQSALN